MHTRLLVTLLSCLPIVAGAQTLTGVKVEPKEAKVGQEVKITNEFDVSGGLNCGLRMHFGDGQTMDFKINQEKDVPLVVGHTYAKPGTYEIMAEPKRNGMILRCGGSNQRVSLNVAGAPAAPAKAGMGMGMAAACPEGWKLDNKSVNKKTGAYTCMGKPGMAMPEKKLECPGELGYFEMPKKGMMGCKP